MTCDHGRKKNDTALVSVIIPVYNSQKYIQKCIESLCMQSYKKIEIICIDDGSKDQSLTLLQEKAKADSRILIFQEENLGAASARNFGIEKAQGDFLLFVDSDDYLDPDYIEKLVEAAQHTDADLVCGGMTMVDEQGRKIQSIIPGRYETSVHEEWVYRIACVACRLYRRTFWEKYGMRFIQEAGARAEDVPLTLFSNAMAENISIVQDAGYYYVQHTGSAMHEYRGLNKYHFPYQTMEDMMESAIRFGVKNSSTFFDYGVIKAFAQFLWIFSAGASRKEIKELCEYVIRMNRKYLHLTLKEINCLNWQADGFSFMQKAAVTLTVICIKTNTLYPAVRVRALFH